MQNDDDEHGSSRNWFNGVAGRNAGQYLQALLRRNTQNFEDMTNT